MDEYYCPNCGATLNDQSGFDPGIGTWTCTECGQYLMDDDIYEGDIFEGVAWYCDNCGALLNRQSGFSDSLGSWTCTECYHVNGTTEDDILDDDEIIKCPSCGGALNKQSGFNEYGYDCECAYCGAKLHRNYTCDDFEEIDEKLICPNCDAYLPSQSGFSEYDDDWTCDECGAKLHRDYSIDPYEAVDQSSDYDMNDEEEDYEEDDNKYYTRSTSYSPPKQSYSFSSTPKTNKKRWTWKKIKKLIKKIFISVMITFFICYFGYYILQEYKKIEIEFDSNSFIGEKYETVFYKLTTVGFDNINVVPLNDLSLNEENLSGAVDSIIIDGKKEFSINEEFLDDAEIIIYYHSLKLITPPIDSKSAKGEDYNTIKQQFEDSGFVNIKVEIMYDLILGWFTKDGEVESVTINSNSKFGEKDEYRPDAEVIITYHTFKKNAK